MTEGPWYKFIVELRLLKTEFFYCEATGSSHAAALAQSNNPGYEVVSIHYAKESADTAD